MNFAARILTFLFFMILTSAVRAEELKVGREIISGKIYHTMMATSKDDNEATVFADVSALRALITECGMVHKEIKVYERTISKEKDGKYLAISKAGLDFDDCEKAKKIAGTPAEEKYENKILAMEIGLRKKPESWEVKKLQEQLKQAKEELQMAKEHAQELKGQLEALKTKGQPARTTATGKPAEDMRAWLYATDEKKCVAMEMNYAEAVYKFRSQGFQVKSMPIGNGIHGHVKVLNDVYDFFTDKQACEAFTAKS